MGARDALVPASLSSPLGILDVSTLQFLLSPSDRTIRCHAPATNNDDRPPSSELARAYGVATTVPPPNQRKRHVLVPTKRHRRPAPSKLEPMERTLKRTAMERPLGAKSYGVDPQKSTGMTLPAVSRSPEHVVRRDHDLRLEFDWIHAHFPVLRLANPKCSLALRQQLFVDTITKNLVRRSLRCALIQWQLVVMKQKQMEASMLKAFKRLVAMFDHVARDQVARGFVEWVQYVGGCRATERLAAAIAIREWLGWCRQRHDGRQHLLALSLQQALATANAHAAKIQQRYRVYVAQQTLSNALRAVDRIQRWVRATKRRHLILEEQAAAKKLECLYAQMRHHQQLDGLIMKSRARQALKIGQAWRQYIAWRQQLVHDYVEDLVDKVEFLAAVASIQRHLRGYRCRVRLKRKLKASLCIQKTWRQYRQRITARQQRKMLLLTQNMAASCLQRTFQRNRERKKHRAIMQKSSRPMFMRALVATPSFRVRYHIPIVKSAASVIQSTWRRHVAYTQWKLTRDAAARRIQRWQHHVEVFYAWQSTAHQAVTCNRERRNHEAARRLQRWFCIVTQTKRALATHQFMELLTAAITIQRYCRWKKDPWRCLGRTVLRVQLPRYRRATATIQRSWRVYIDRKRHLLSLYGVDGDIIPHSLGFHDLKDYLLRQQLDLERRERDAKTIQKAFRHHRARCEGKLMLKRYRVLFQRDVRRRQQRQIIHGFLSEKQDERMRRQQARSTAASPSSPSVTSSPVSVDTSSPETDSSQASPMETLEEERPEKPPMGDDPDVVQVWSDEHQSFYWFNSRTGESAWCT